MSDNFITNYTETKFIDYIINCFNNCKTFYLTVSFIKEAGLVLLKRAMEEALKRGAKGRIITSTYMNFTDISSLRTFLNWQEEYENFSCHIDYECFNNNGFHTKGYLFEMDECYEFLVGSTNITRYALLKNIEWNVAISHSKTNQTILNVIKEFDYLRNRTLSLNNDLIRNYTIQIEYAIEKWDMDFDIKYESKLIMPNSMQKKALKELRRYRDMGVDRSLIIAATASGKTYLAAFDARNFDAKRLLFIVHRETILEDARNTFQKVFLSKRTYGLFTGNKQETGSDFIFATNTMLSSHLEYFDPEEFDYIVFDECHHISASTYQKILTYFRPKFLLGLTATPERMDNQDITSIFDKNVPYELRLRDAIKNDLVVPFKYYGVRDEMIDYSSKDKSRFLNEYYKPEHCQFIVDEIEKHRPEGKLKAIAFCRSIEHANLMSHAMSELGYCTVSLTGQNLTGQRMQAYSDLQDNNHPLEIIFTVDILNEGVDIPGINMVLFLRPTESQTIFIQQLGRGLRKYEGKEFLTVLDFIGNSYERSIQIAFGLGTLTSSNYLEKALISSLVRDDFKSLNLPGVEIHFDEYSKEEILKYIDKTNFNNLAFLKQDYYNFKKYIMNETYPSHMDYLNNDCAPDLLRFMKSKIKGKKNFSYYNFLKNIDEDIPLFNESEIKLLENVSDLLPLTRREEYLVIQRIIKGESFEDLVSKYSRLTHKSLENSKQNLIKRKIIKENARELELKEKPSESFIFFISDLLLYGLERYEVEFGDFDGIFKLYGNYQKDKIMVEIDGKQYTYMQGTKYDIETKTTYIFVGLKKDVIAKEKFEYKDKFLSPTVFQWESVNNTTKENVEGKKLLETKLVHLFVRKMDDEDGIILPFTYFGTGTLTNCRESSNKGHPTLLFDIKLDNVVPEDYRYDYQVPDKKTI